MPDEAIIFDQIVARRRSMRAFLPQPVGAETMGHLFGTAQRAPSNCNTQPWVVHVASGASLERLRQALPRRFVAGEFKPDFPYDGVYEGIYKERQYGAAWALYDSVGVERQDKPARHAQFMRNFVFFDAPHVAFLCLPEPFGLREAADLGMYAQTLMLAMAAHGLGSCPQTSLSFHAEFIRETLGIDARNKLLFGIAFGHPDRRAAANRCITGRAPVAEAVTFHA